MPRTRPSLLAALPHLILPVALWYRYYSEEADAHRGHPANRSQKQNSVPGLFDSKALVLCRQGWGCPPPHSLLSRVSLPWAPLPRSISQSLTLWRADWGWELHCWLGVGREHIKRCHSLMPSLNILGSCFLTASLLTIFCPNNCPCQYMTSTTVGKKCYFWACTSPYLFTLLSYPHLLPLTHQPGSSASICLLVYSSLWDLIWKKNTLG